MLSLLPVCAMTIIIVMGCHGLMWWSSPLVVIVVAGAGVVVVVGPY